MGNNAVQFQSCDGSSYCTELGENGCTDIVSRQACEIRAVIRYLHTQKQSPAEIHRHIYHVYGPDIMSNKIVGRWCGQFTEGLTNVQDEDRSGRPSLVTPEMMESVQQEVLQNRRSTFSELSSISADV